MCNPVVGTWMKFILTGGSVAVGRVTDLTDESITIDNAAPTAEGYHRSFTFAMSEVVSCGPADPQKDHYTEP
jgi:hypothetical protein